MASPAHPIDDRFLDRASEQTPIIRALISGLIAHTATGVVSTIPNRDPSPDGD